MHQILTLTNSDVGRTRSDPRSPSLTLLHSSVMCDAHSSVVFDEAVKLEHEFETRRAVDHKRDADRI